MSRSLIIYKVEYNLKSDPWDYGYGNDKFKKVKRIVMTPEEVNQTDGYWRNHARVERKFFKQMGYIESDTYNSRYRIKRINKA